MMTKSSVTAGAFVIVAMILLGLALFGCAQAGSQPLAISLGTKIGLSIFIGIVGLCFAGVIFLAQANMPTGDGSPGAVTILIVATALIALLCFFGCANKPMNAPSSTAVEGGLSRVQSGVSEAKAQNSDIVKYNAQARSYSQQINDKNVLETRYREYRATHPQPSPTP